MDIKRKPGFTSMKILRRCKMFMVEQEPIYLQPCVREHFFKSSNEVE